MTDARQELLLPSFNYYLDETNPDMFILRRQDDSFVAAFSARGATKEGIFEAAKEDHRQRIRDRWRLGGKAPEEQHSA